MEDPIVVTHRHLDSAGNGVCVIGGDGTISYANAALARMLGWRERQALVGRTWTEVGLADGRVHEVVTAALRGVDGVAESADAGGNDTERQLLFGATPLRSSRLGDVAALVTVWERDAEAGTAESQSHHSGRTEAAGAGPRKRPGDDASLVRELNHRVANNLAMLSALVDLKLLETTDGEDLREIQQHIAAIRRIHERLGRCTAHMDVELSEYLRDLVHSFFATFGAGKISIQEAMEPVTVSSSVALLLGLIVNEIATNAVKHGVAAGDSGTFVVELHQEPAEDRCRLVLANHGPPFPDDIDPATTQSGGLQLVWALVQQLEGTIELTKRPHPAFTIRVPTKAAR
ncbi:MAG: histidine kinase dimerization/phosphoacceptor domain -containing protein [Spirochaetaceae bacterium]